MDAIKKKMTAMKIEKENALDKSDQLDQKLSEQKEVNEKVRTCVTNVCVTNEHGQRTSQNVGACIENNVQSIRNQTNYRKLNRSRPYRKLHKSIGN